MGKTERGKQKDLKIVSLCISDMAMLVRKYAHWCSWDISPQALLVKTMNLLLVPYTGIAIDVDNYSGNIEVGKQGQQFHLHSKISCTLWQTCMSLCPSNLPITFNSVLIYTKEIILFTCHLALKLITGRILYCMYQAVTFLKIQAVKYLWD